MTIATCASCKEPIEQPDWLMIRSTFWHPTGSCRAQYLRVRDKLVIEAQMNVAKASVWRRLQALFGED